MRPKPEGYVFDKGELVKLTTETWLLPVTYRTWKNCDTLFEDFSRYFPKNQVALILDHCERKRYFILIGKIVYQTQEKFLRRLQETE
jgi:hypothetical protein